MDKQELQAQEATRILQAWAQNPQDAAALFGVSARPTLLEIVRKHEYYTTLFKASQESSQLLDIVEKAYKALLADYSENYRESPLSLLVFFIAAIFSILSWGYMLIHLWPYITWLSIAFSFFIAYVLADFISGLIHIALDHWIAINNPLLGHLALDFILHHDHPQVITTTSKFQLIKPFVVFFISSATMISWMFFISDHIGPILVLFWLSINALLLQIFHSYAHLDHPPSRLVAYLQKWGILLSPQIHHQHHTSADHSINFCVFSGMCNPLVNWLFRHSKHYFMRK